MSGRSRPKLRQLLSHRSLSTRGFMTADIRLVGLDAKDATGPWLRETVSELKGGDVLAPVTVICGSRAAALSLRRELARKGSVNVRFAVLAELAEALGSPTLAAQGLSPLTPVLEQALVRSLLADPAAGSLRSRCPHPSTVAALAREIRRLRERGVRDGELTRLVVGRGTIAEGFARLFVAYGQRLSALKLYDAVDLIHAATLVVTEAVARREVGAVLAYLPLRISPDEASFLRALARRVPVVVASLEGQGAAPSTTTGTWPAESDAAVRRIGARLENVAGADSDSVVADAPARRRGDEIQGRPPTNRSYERPTAESEQRTANSKQPTLHIIIAPSAGEEVRIAIRRALADCEEGVPLYRMAILHNDEESYGGLLRDTLSSAAIPFTVLGGRPLAESYAAKGLLGLLGLRESDFSRLAVLAWLSSFPRRDRDIPPTPVWDRISREAGIVRGTASWQGRMLKLAEGKRTEAANMAADPDETEPPPAQRKLLRDAEMAETMAALLGDIDVATAPPKDRSWHGLSDWAIRLFEGHVSGGLREGIEAEAEQMVEEVLGSLAAAHHIETEASIDTLVQTVAQVFETKRQPVGRLGAGLVVGRVSAAAGMRFSRLHVLGMSERRFPSQQQPNSFVAEQGENDPLDDRTQLVEEQALAFATACAAVEASGRIDVSVAIWDEAGRPVYPSRWLVEAAGSEFRVQSSERRSTFNVQRSTSGAKLPRDGSARGRSPEAVGLTSTALRAMTSNEWLTAIPSPLAGLLRAPTDMSVHERRLHEAATWALAKRPLRLHALAQRQDLALARLLAVRAARWSDRLTAADGNLGDASLGGKVELRLELSDRPQSATGLEVWATCPFKYFLGRVLWVEPTQLPEDQSLWSASPLDIGSAVHRILQRFFAEDVRRLSDPGSASETREQQTRRMGSIAGDELDRMEAEGVSGHPLVWAATRQGIIADLGTLLERDSELRSAGGWQPVALEQPFGSVDEGGGTAWPAVAVKLGNRGPIEFRGRIDRIDRNVRGATRVIDYKTGKARYSQKDLDQDPVQAGAALQLGLYGRAAREAWPESGEVTAGYWFVSSRGRFEMASVPADRATIMRLDATLESIAAGIGAGAFPQIPGVVTERPGRSGWDNCIYCAFDRICPAGRDAVRERKAGDTASMRHAALEVKV
jgi:ATP-dependent helicase/nuclease subunit B